MNSKFYLILVFFSSNIFLGCIQQKSNKQSKGSNPKIIQSDRKDSEAEFKKLLIFVIEG